MSNRSKSWSWRHAILDSGLPPTTRHVLLTISCCMNELGEGCYRTTREFAEFTGLSERAVCEHIQKACDAGWIIKTKHGFRGQKWKTHDYKAAWPDQQKPVKGTDPNDRKALTEGQQVEGKALTLLPKGTDPNDRKALTEGQQDKNDSVLSHNNLNTSLHCAREPIETINLRKDDLITALGENANNRANGNFMVWSTIINWLENGCDLDLDVLPVVQARSAGRSNITTWGYFSGAVFEARDKRLRPAPAPPVNSGGERMVTLSERIAELQMEAEDHG